MYFFRISNMAAAIVLDFQKFEILTVDQQRQYALPCKISSKLVQRLWKYRDIPFFSKWRRFAILDLLDAYLDHPRSAVGGVYRCAKFDWNWCSSFDNMKFWYFASLAGQRHSRSVIGDFGGDMTPYVGCDINRSPNSTSLGRRTSSDT